ncbi:MAG: DUF4038 domain-containing protein [Oscillospiraceae bacterium]|nr:DUF4038 domain-containing protein [Oscillospiraceae bacterium]
MTADQGDGSLDPRMFQKGEGMMQVHVWETVEIELTARNDYKNAYMEVDVWAHLTGPQFDKKIYGFWDGGGTFKIRIAAMRPGEWSYTTHSSVADPGLDGVSGAFTAVEWTEAEKIENPSRRGIIAATANGRALQYADGTPVYLLGDTIWSIFTDRFPWHGDAGENQAADGMSSSSMGNAKGAPGSDKCGDVAGASGGAACVSSGGCRSFQDVVLHRKKQGFNLIATLSALPNWRDDGHPAHFETAEGYVLRSGWRHPAKTLSDGITPRDSVKEMKNEGGFPFLFPGKVPGYGDLYPDMERPNDAYFKYLDRKMAWLTSQGMTVFIETIRRDLSTCFKQFYQWPEAFIRYTQFIFARYHTYNCIFSPIHFDSPHVSIPASDYNHMANLYIERYGPPPFGTLVSCNSSPSSFINFGHTDKAKWLTLHQIGNAVREHDGCWYLTEIFEQSPPLPAMNGEPYYPGASFGGGRDDAHVHAFCEEANLRSRSQLYGSLLSGGLAGYIYGCEGMWNGNNEPEAFFKYWDTLTYPSADQLRHILAFIGIVGDRYRDLIPRTEYVSPSKFGDERGHKGWAYCAGMADRSEFLIFFEVDCPRCEFRSQQTGTQFEAVLFDPREGCWINADSPDIITIGTTGKCLLPAKPDRMDYGLYLKRV